MITEVRGNLLRDDAQALVNTVNTVGVMGKGLALQFKRAYPDVFVAYRQACDRGEVETGKVFAAELPDDRWVLNFPTKRSWRDPSRMEDIRTGLDDLVCILQAKRIRSVAVPPLGCGNGGLRWEKVKPLIEQKLASLDVDVRLYLPGTPPPADMPTAGERPRLTAERARLLAALGRYIAVAWNTGVTEVPRASLLEVQKIAYLLQSAGSSLGLRFEPYKYGPFSAALNRGLAQMEGHFILGYGDGTGGARADIELFDQARLEAEALVSDDSEFAAAWARVERIVSGYSYPEGVELLASVHLLVTRATEPWDAKEIAEKIAAWTPRKRELFNLDDVSAALDHLAGAEII